MPTYEYACRDCGEHLEVVQSFRDDALTECPHCQGELRKVFSAAGIIFKGSGWHIKDYASSKGAPSTSSSEGSDAKPGSKSESTSESGSDSSSGSKDASSKGSSTGGSSSTGSSSGEKSA